MKTRLLLGALLLPAVLAAQQTTPPPAAPVTAATLLAPPDSVALDSIVAVVGDSVILWSDVLAAVYQRRAQGMPMPTDSAGQLELARSVVNDLVDQQVLVQEARRQKVEVADADIAPSVDQQIQRVREQFKSDAEYREALKAQGFGTPEEYRRSLMDQARTQALIQRLLDKLHQDNKLVTVGVSDAELREAYEREKATLPKRPAQVTFRQIVVRPMPSAAAKARALAKADSILAELRRGGDFEQIAKRESMDQESRQTGGDMGWLRRGATVPEFERVLFSLNPGQISNVVETYRGYHIIKVDRVQPGEVKARQILIQPEIDSADIQQALVRADSVAALWRRGVPFDTLVARYHDPNEYKAILDPFDRSQLPPSYAAAMKDAKPGDITAPFRIEDPQMGIPKFVVAQLLTATEGGDYTFEDLRQQLRDQLSQEKSMRRYIDQLRKQTFVSLRI